MDRGLDSTKTIRNVRHFFLAACAVFFLLVFLSSCTLLFPPPEIPKLLSPSNGSKEVAVRPTLHWEKQNAVKYTLYLGKGTPLQAIARNIEDSSYTVSSSLNYSTDYMWGVEAKNFSGISTSEIWTFRTKSLPVPNAPRDFETVWLGSNAVRLRWKDESSNEDGFLLKREGTKSTSIILNKNSTSYTDLDLQPLEEYTYTLTAFNSYGKSSTLMLKVQTPGKTQGTLRWRFDTLSKELTTPTMDASGIVYFASKSGTLYAVKEAKMLWKKDIGPTETFPVIDENAESVYVANENGTVYAFGKSGDLKWKEELSPFPSSPAVGDDDIYIHAGRYLYSLSKGGKIRWKTDVGISSGNPVVGKNAVYVGGGDWYLYAVAKNGNVLWKYKTGVLFSTPLLSTPSLDSTENIYLEGVDWYLYRFDRQGTLTWKFKGNALRNFTSPMLDSKGKIYFSDGNGDLNVIEENGTPIKHCKGSILTSPVIGEKGIYIGGEDGIYLFNEESVDLIYTCKTVSNELLLDDSILYFTVGNSLYALNVSSQHTKGIWPVFQHDLQRSGKLCGK